MDWSAAWSDLYARLHAKYGKDRAARIVDGEDPATVVDLQRWHALGKRKQARQEGK
jgi:hypothetical protein